MPFVTLNYDLEAFTQGEIYSSSADRRRFVTIDNLLAFLSDQVGDGRIEGWDVSVSSLSLLQISVSPGWGVIDRFVNRTFGSSVVQLPDSGTVNLYMRRRINLLGGYSGYSNLSQVIVVDTTSPSVPTGLQAAATAYNHVVVNWTANTEADISNYVVLRSINNIDFSEVGTSSANNYTDIAVSEDTLYYYSLQSVDLSGNSSAATSSVSVRTPRDLTQPLPPSAIQWLPGDGLVELIWFESPFGSLDRYEVNIQEVNGEYDPVGSPIIQTVSLTQTHTVIRNLTNDSPYRMILYAVSTNGVYSVGVQVIATPTSNAGPAEVDNVDVSFVEGPNDVTNVVMNLSWTIEGDPYAALPEKFVITLMENGTDISSPIIVSGSFSYSISTIPFQDIEGIKSNRSIEPGVRYLVKVQSRDTEDRTSNGVIVPVRAPSFQDPPAASSVDMYLAGDNSVFATWQNSTSSFLSHNIISASITDGSGSVTTLALAENVGRSNTYTIDASYFDADVTYAFSIYAVDEFGNTSDTVEVTLVTNEILDISEPVLPDNQIVTPGDGYVKIQWNYSLDPNLVSVKIWRGELQSFPVPSDFTLVDTVSASAHVYQDFTVTNDTTYMYVLSSVDQFGRETSNPGSGITPGVLLFVKPRSFGDFSPPSDLSVSQSGFNANLSWTLEPDVFDGYEVYRSEGDLCSFVFVGNASHDDTSYVDEDALLKNGVTYSYNLRKYRDEADPFLTESDVPPSGATKIATIEIIDGSIEIDETPATELKYLEDPVRTAAIEAIDAHKHTFTTNGLIDRRIDLSSNIEIDDWNTNDFQNYTTTNNMDGASAYLITLSGTVNEVFFTDSQGNINTAAIDQVARGIPPFLFEVSAASKKITFEQPLYSESSNIVTPYSDVPSLTLQLLGASETQGVLPASRIESLDALQFNSGLLDKSQIITFHHDGRLDESLVPATSAMSSMDRFTYSFVDSTVSFDTEAIAFYDAIGGNEQQDILACTSRGLMYSEDFGSTWDSRLLTDTAPLKALYSSGFDRFFVATNNDVYVSMGSLDSWAKTPGLENIKSIRDMIEHSSGDLFLTTDLGVYRLVYGGSDQSLIWQQLSLFGPRSTEAYAIIEDSDRSRILVSSELGILESSNLGVSWSLSSEFDESKKIFTFVESNGNIFALTKDSVWRKSGDQDFAEVAELTGSMARKMVVFNDRLYVTTDAGSFASPDSESIYTDSDIGFIRTFPEMNHGNSIVPAFSLNIVDGELLVGTDQKLFVCDTSGRMRLQYSSELGVPPTVYKNDVPLSVGVRYNIGLQQTVSFDEQVAYNDSVSSVVSYMSFIATYGGWSDLKSDAHFLIRSNATIVVDSDNQTVDDSSSTEILIGTTTVDTSSGLVIFETSYDKYDVMTIDIKGVTLSNIGTIPHRELEDDFEDLNSGLPSSLSQVQQSNIVKLGIFNEKTWPGQQGNFVTPWQSTYIVPRDRSWYDMLNSSVDYGLEASSSETNFTLPYAATTLYVSDERKVLAGGYGGLLSIDIDNFDTNVITVDLDRDVIVKDLEIVGDDIYLIDDLNIYKSSDGGLVWVRQNRTGLPDHLYSFGFIANVFLVGAEDGLYFRTEQQDEWSRALESSTPVEVMLGPDLLFAVIDNSNLYRTANGIAFVWAGEFKDYRINTISKFRSMIYAATSKGLRKDDGSFYGGSAGLSLVNMYGDAIASASVVVNDVDSSSELLVAGISDGSFAVMQSSGFVIVTNAPLDTIQNVLIQDSRLWLFGYDRLVIYDDIDTTPQLLLGYPMQLSTGVPI
jgi:hypothetical protein